MTIAKNKNGPRGTAFKDERLPVKEALYEKKSDIFFSVY